MQAPDGFDHEHRFSLTIACRICLTTLNYSNAKCWKRDRK